MSNEKWLVTGAAGFIGSHLVEALLKQGQWVRGVDNFLTGRRASLDAVRMAVGSEDWARFELLEGDLRDSSVAKRAVLGMRYVLHQAALSSVPRSIAEPEETRSHNVTAFMNLLEAAQASEIRRVVYASSSAVYGDDPTLPKQETQPTSALSPYAASKIANEVDAERFSVRTGVETVGLRYFNVFGRRQDPNGPYAAVIPKWVEQLLRGEIVEIYGDGETTRDFCYIENVIDANLAAAQKPLGTSNSVVLNIATGGRTTLNELYAEIARGLSRRKTSIVKAAPRHLAFRAGDIRHSQADISRARALIGYEPRFSLRQGLEQTLDWYCENFR